MSPWLEGHGYLSPRRTLPPYHAVPSPQSPEEPEEPARFKSIEGTVTLEDGSTSMFMLYPEGDWYQWGAGQERLGESVELMDAMVRGLSDEGLLREE